MAEPTLTDRITVRIAHLVAEIARVHAAADTTAAELEGQIALLQRAARAVNPETESLLAALKAQGIL